MMFLISCSLCQLIVADFFMPVMRLTMLLICLWLSIRFSVFLSLLILACSASIFFLC